MITTLSTQGGRRYPQLGSTGLAFVGRLSTSGSGGAVVTTTLRGKPIRRRGRSRPRFEEIVDQINEGQLEAVAKQYSEVITKQAQEIASARTDFEIEKQLMKRGKERSERLSILEARIEQAENYMIQLMEEEELIIILALSI